MTIVTLTRFSCSVRVKVPDWPELFCSSRSKSDAKTGRGVVVWVVAVGAVVVMKADVGEGELEVTLSDGVAGGWREIRKARPIAMTTTAPIIQLKLLFIKLRIAIISKRGVKIS